MDLKWQGRGVEHHPRRPGHQGIWLARQRRRRLRPIAQVLGRLGLSGTIPGLILVHTVYGICFTTLFFRNYFVTIPDELVKVAQIDGAGFLRIFSIMLPAALPIVVVSCMWKFTRR